MQKSKFMYVITVVVSVLCMCVGCNSTPTANSIEVTKLPYVTEYELNEEFSAEGGEVTATFADGSQTVASLTDPEVTLSEVKTEKAGKKTVTVTYAGRRTRFSVTVKPIVVSFDLGKGMGTLDSIELKQVGKISLPTVNAVDGWEFAGWYTDAARTALFDANVDISNNMTLYASWVDVGATYYDVTFDYNYYGSLKASIQKVKEDTSPSEPSEPTRNGYSFDGWYTQASGGNEFDFTDRIGQDVTVYAHWTRTVGDTPVEYVFEAEDIDLKGLMGHGYSSEAGGILMIQNFSGAPNLGTSNDRCVGYTYNNGLVFNFRIIADKAVSDAKIVARLTGELKDFTINPNLFDISLNGNSINYGEIDFTNIPNMAVRAFEDYELIVNASLREGENLISMKVTNSINWVGGGTVAATAPIIDCVKVTTSAVLWWDGNYGLPKKNY